MYIVKDMELVMSRDTLTGVVVIGAMGLAFGYIFGMGLGLV